MLLPVFAMSQQTMEAIDDSTVVRKTWVSTPTTVIDTLEQLRIVYLRDTVIRDQAFIRVDTIRNIPDVDEFLDKLSLLPVYESLNDSAKQVIDNYLNQHYNVRKVIRIYD